MPYQGEGGIKYKSRLRQCTDGRTICNQWHRSPIHKKSPILIQENYNVKNAEVNTPWIPPIRRTGRGWYDSGGMRPNTLTRIP